jgi:hypothetical protein
MFGVEGKDLPVNLLGLRHAARSVMAKRFDDQVLNERRMLALMLQPIDCEGIDTLSDQT